MATEPSPRVDRHADRNLSGHLTDTVSDTVSVQRAAQLCQTSERTIARYVRQGRLRSVKQGKRRLICLTSITDMQRQVSQSAAQSLGSEQDTARTELHESLADIRQLICALVELYHPKNLSEMARKHELQSRIRHICQERNKEQRHD